MKEAEAIRNHPLFAEAYKKLEQAEKDRVFCRHQMEHLLAVARLAYISSLEQNLPVRREVIYAAALLHDIGKYKQYTEGIPHEIASAQIAESILRDLPAGMYTEEEIEDILSAIRGHRWPEESSSHLGRLLYEGDKKSRLCFSCGAQEECDWGAQKKNKEIIR